MHQSAGIDPDRNPHQPVAVFNGFEECICSPIDDASHSGKRLAEMEDEALSSRASADMSPAGQGATPCVLDVGA